MKKCAILDYCKKHGIRDRGTIGSTFLRVDGLVNNDPDFELWTQGAKYEAMIFQKVYMTEMWKRYKGIKILDICDPDWLRLPEKGGFEPIEASNLVDAITCSSPYLAEALKKIIKKIPVICIPDRLNFKVFPDNKPLNLRVGKVVWFGYAHNADKVLTNTLLQRLAENNISLLVVSNDNFRPQYDYGLKVENVRYNSSTAYYEIQKADLVLNPKHKSSQFKYKSNNKTIIGWKLGLPVAETAQDFVRLLDFNERQREVNEKLELVNRDYNIIKSGTDYKQLICDIQRSKNTK